MNAAETAAAEELDARTARATKSPNGVGWSPYTIDVRTVEAARAGVYRLVLAWLARHRSTLATELRAATASFVAGEQGQLGAQRFLSAEHVDAYVAVVRVRIAEGAWPSQPVAAPPDPVDAALAAARALVELFRGDRFGADFPARRDAALARVADALDEAEGAGRR